MGKNAVHQRQAFRPLCVAMGYELPALMNQPQDAQESRRDLLG